MRVHSQRRPIFALTNINLSTVTYSHNINEFRLFFYQWDINGICVMSTHPLPLSAAHVWLRKGCLIVPLRWESVRASELGSVRNINTSCVPLHLISCLIDCGYAQSSCIVILVIISYHRVFDPFYVRIIHRMSHTGWFHVVSHSHSQFSLSIQIAPIWLELIIPGWLFDLYSFSCINSAYRQY